jgi:hypothetical protein
MTIQKKLKKKNMNWYKQAQNILQISRNDYAGYDPKRRYDGFSDEEKTIIFDNVRKKQKEWDAQISKALGEGKISPEKAFNLGYDLTQDRYQENSYKIPGYGKLSPLPEILYHVTTSKNKVIADQLKTRDELSQGPGVGLGGGTSDTISFTENLKIAQDIYRTLIEGRRATIGELSLEQMVSQAKEGVGTNGKPWINEWVDAHKSNIGTQTLEDMISYINSDYEHQTKIFPETVEEVNKNEKNHWEPIEESKMENKVPPAYRKFKRLLSHKEKAYRRFRAYHTWAWSREFVGGPEYGLFSFNDEQGLSNVPENQIAILEFRARPGSMGYQVSALGEWRTWSGSTVDLAGEVDYELV